MRQELEWTNVQGQTKKKESNSIFLHITVQHIDIRS
jgi:hypothetical protein